MLISSCWHRAQPHKQHHKATVDYTKLFGKIQGTWISYEYMLNLNKTTSPSESAPLMDGIFSFAIDSIRLSDDTLHCVAWVSGHAERDLWIAFDSPDSIGLFSIGLNKSKGDENEATNQGMDNITKVKIDSPYITIYTSTFDSVRYVYYDNLPKNTPADYALRRYTTSALFRGKYYTADSNMVFGSSTIYFDPKNIGRISGSQIYDSFDINVNMINQQDSINYMELFDSRKQNESKSFIYSIKKNILRIYPALDSPQCVLHKMQSEDTLLRP